MASNVSKTTFEFDVINAKNSINSLISDVNRFENLANKPISLTVNSSQLNKEFDTLKNQIINQNNFVLKQSQQAEREKLAFTKQANADILRIKNESVKAELAIERQLTKQVNAENRLRVNDAKRANAEALRELNNPNTKLFESARESAIQQATGSQNAVNAFNRRPQDAPNVRQNLQLSSFQKQNLSYQANDVLTGLASGQNITQIIAQQSGQIAQIFSAEQAALLVSRFASLIPILGAGAIAIGAVYKITGDIRAEAERRLKVEELITGAVNKQVLGQQKAVAETAKLRQLADSNRQFQDANSRSDLDDLIARRKRLEDANNRNNAQIGIINKDKKFELIDNESYTIQRNQLLELDALIAQKTKEQQNRQDELFRQRGEQFSLIQDREKAESEERAKRQLEAQEQFKKSVEDGKAKVVDLGKVYNSVFDSISAKSNLDNPFVRLFTDADKSMKLLRENTKGLSADLVKTFENLERQQNGLSLFSTRLDTNLSAFNLRDDAEKFRNFGSNKPTSQAEIDAIVNRNINGSNSIGAIYNKSFGSNLALQVGGANNLTESQKREIYEQSLLQNVSGLNRDSLISTLARERNGSNQDLTIQERLDKQLDIVRGSGANSEAERRIADKKIIELTSSLNPNDLTASQRDISAQVREREAERLLRAESEAIQQREKGLLIQQQIKDELIKLNSIAEKQGLKGIESLIKIVDETNGAVRVTKTPNRQDTANAFQD